MVTDLLAVPSTRELDLLLGRARRQGVTPILIAIVADPTEPDVARLRAFGRILVELDCAPRRGRAR
jgi:hypothetical protein